MLENISIWIQSIIVAIAITTIIEMVLPENNNKKYIKIVCSLYILYTILSPVFNKTKFELNNFLIENSVETASIDTSGILNVYEDAYKEEIKDFLIKNGFEVESIIVSLDKQDIKRIDINYNEASDNDKEKITNLIKNKYGVENIMIKWGKYAWENKK